VLEQVFAVVSYDGFTVAPLPASTLQLNSVTPVAWLVAVGGLWQSVQAKAVARVPAARCAAWAPTAAWEASVSPRVPFGGMAAMLGAVPARAGSPWQETQVIVSTLTVPFRWVATLTVVWV
jgi:hypothetical protein